MLIHKCNYSRFVFFVGSLLFFMNGVAAVHRCYVCGSSASSSGRSAVSEGSNVLPCSRFDATDDKNVWAEFKQDCPPRWKGCSTISSTSHGGEHYRVNSRSCQKEAFNDCQIANNVKYCYCNQSLCNGKLESGGIDFNDDDEDADIEGSGSSISSLTTIAPRVSVVTHSSATSTIGTINRSIILFVLSHALYYYN